MHYQSVIVTQRGGPEVLRVVEKDLRPPSGGEARIKILATSVCRPDVQARYGRTPISPRVPFVPGYAVVGVVDAVGPGVTVAATGDPVGALTVFGGYAEYIYLAEEQLIPVPAALDPAEAVTLILNYVVAYQTLHRSARVKAGDRVLIIGASGGVGTALLQLGRLATLRMYGIASKNKHHILTEFGATPIDYHTQDFVEVIRRAEPDGLDAVFDGMVWGYLDRGFSLLRRGGTWVQYGNPLTFRGLMRLLGRLVLFNVLPNGRSLKLYGTTTSKLGGGRYMEDWATLFRLLEEGKIKPIIMARFPLSEASLANALLESGQVFGNVVLVASELPKATVPGQSTHTGAEMSTVAIAVGLSFLLIILSGIWLSRTGRPLNVAISTIHKLISLAAGVYLSVTVYQRNRQVPLGRAEWIAVVVTGLCFLAMVASGGFLSSDKPMPVAVLRVHQIVPVLTALSTGVTLYLLLGR